MRILMAAALVAGCACSGSGPEPLRDSPDEPGESGNDGDEGDEMDGGAEEAPLSFVAVTMNTGTTNGLAHDSDGDDYGDQQAEISDQYYGDGLAWKDAVDAATEFFSQVEPDVVVFQEVFYSGQCVDVPADKRAGFVCEDWSPGDPTVAQVVLGDGYQVMCHPGKPDKCAAVKRSFGSFQGCDSDFCLEGMTGFRIDNCGGGARIAQGIIDLEAGGTLVLVNVHGTSGLSADDQDCREKQVEQVFVDLGNGSPAVGGARDLIMGDFNTDPGRLADFDDSADHWNDFVEGDELYRFITDVGEEAEPSYSGVLNIDHVIGGGLDGSCWTAGVSEGHPPVTDTVYFDHHPVVCTVGEVAP